MPSHPITKPSDSAHAETVEVRFRQLEAQLMKETGHLSSSNKIIAHPAFREIAGLGLAVVPFMLRDLEKKPRLWVWALPEITGADPVEASERGNIEKMADAWVRWGRSNGCKW